MAEPQTHRRIATSSPTSNSGAHRRTLFAGDRLIGICLVFACLLTLILHDRPLVRGDGLGYLVWVDSIVLDGDLDLANQLPTFAHLNNYQLLRHAKTGKYVNVFPYGVAILQAPFYRLGHLFHAQGWWSQNTDYFLAHQGIAQAYSLWLMIGANCMAIATVLMAWRLGRALTDSATAAIAAFAIFVGTPLLYYSSTYPLNSHNPGAFLCTCFVCLLFHCNGGIGRHSPAEHAKPTTIFTWALLGICAGLMTLTRFQLILLVLPAWGVIAWRRQWRSLAIASAAAALPLLVLMASWVYLFGELTLIPYDALHEQSFFDSPLEALEVLGKLVSFSPVVALALLGLARLWRVHRLWASCFFAMLCQQILINGLALDWHGAEGYGMRRMTELYPVFVLLTCALCGTWRARGRAVPALRQAGARIALLISIPLAFYWLHAYYFYTWSDNGRSGPETPVQMIRFVQAHPHRQLIWQELMDDHVGPAAWNEPGP